MKPSFHLSPERLRKLFPKLYWWRLKRGIKTFWSYVLWLK